MEIILVDVISFEDFENLVEKVMEILGGKLDFVFYFIGMFVNVRKGKYYID